MMIQMKLRITLVRYIDGRMKELGLGTLVNKWHRFKNGLLTEHIWN